MIKHIHFLLLALGTMGFLMIVLRYSAPLISPDHKVDRYTDATTLAYNQINDIAAYDLHVIYMIKMAIKAFAYYLGFVVIIFAHRVFYPPKVAVPLAAVN